MIWTPRLSIRTRRVSPESHRQPARKRIILGMCCLPRPVTLRNRIGALPVFRPPCHTCRLRPRCIIRAARLTHPWRCAIAVHDALAGREREQATLRECLDAALAGRGGLVLIGGEAGIGKTALAESCCVAATAAGALALTGRCYDLTETPPYGPWLDLFSRYHPADMLPPPPAIFAARGSIGTASSQAAIIAQCETFFRDLVGVRPAVLLLDDLHWADPASVDLLRALARAARALPLLILVTYRTDAQASASPLGALLPTLVREAEPERLVLPRLTEAAIRRFVAARYPLADEDTRRLSAYLAKRSEGNPFFLGELTRAMEEEGALTETSDGWRIADMHTARVPTLVRQVIGNRVARFAAAERHALAVAAVIGQEVPVALWQRASEMEDDALLALIERAVAAQVLTASEDGEAVRFFHALTREALYEDFLPMRRRVWHRRIGEELAALPAPDPDAVASHFEHAGDARALPWLLRAGERAQAAYSYGDC